MTPCTDDQADGNWCGSSGCGREGVMPGVSQDFYDLIALLLKRDKYPHLTMLENSAEVSEAGKRHIREARAADLRLQDAEREQMNRDDDFDAEVVPIIRDWYRDMYPARPYRLGERYNADGDPVDKTGRPLG